MELDLGKAMCFLHVCVREQVRKQTHSAGMPACRLDVRKFEIRTVIHGSRAAPRSKGTIAAIAPLPPFSTRERRKCSKSFRTASTAPAKHETYFIISKICRTVFHRRVHGRVLAATESTTIYRARSLALHGTPSAHFHSAVSPSHDALLLARSFLRSNDAAAGSTPPKCTAADALKRLSLTLACLVPHVRSQPSHPSLVRQMREERQDSASIT